jgi:hypothetical protein
MNVWWVRLGEPLLCRLGFHKWQNYGNQILISWKEPHVLPYVDAANKSYSKGQPFPSREELEVEANEALVTHTKVVYEGKKCKRCGMKLKRKFEKNSDGTLSCIGWEPDTEETDKNRP